MGILSGVRYQVSLFFKGSNEDAAFYRPEFFDELFRDFVNLYFNTNVLLQIMHTEFTQIVHLTIVFVSTFLTFIFVIRDDNNLITLP